MKEYNDDYKQDSLEFNGEFYDVSGTRTQICSASGFGYECCGVSGTEPYTEVEEERFDFDYCRKYDEATDCYIDVKDEKEKKEIAEYILSIMD